MSKQYLQPQQPPYYGHYAYYQPPPQGYYGYPSQSYMGQHMMWGYPSHTGHCSGEQMSSSPFGRATGHTPRYIYPALSRQ